MEKLLKPYTIVPDHLYVQRDADKQVASIISDMGRPGYVLVSRQMGKTNLLLNAKSKLEKAEDAFIYVDLSNVFDTPRECFENIIDTALESHHEKFISVKEDINEQRKSSANLPPHRQHINELKILIESLQGGKLVVILDEIDALTKTDYSDQIFSQIRSMYFSARVNNNNFNKLTYLLSGVVEPNEIIKDQKVSPFNIGQKIYLNDFSKLEFYNFLNLAGLNLDKISKDRIYFWTNGNPRITWDVCSEIENQIETRGCSEDLIDSIVNDLYFKTYDKAPVDNIREIVSKDKELRNSIVELTYNKGKSISDKLKSKLYLSGIINYNDDNVIIKNEIIKRSLNLDWIRSLEKEDKGVIQSAIEYIKRENYEEAIIGFENYLEDNKFTEDESSLYYYYMGIASYRTSHLEKASEYLNKSNLDPADNGKEFYDLQHLKGTVYYYRNMLEESLDSLKIVLQAKKNDETYMTSLLNYGSFSHSSSKEEHKLKAKEIFNSIVNDETPDRLKNKEKFINEIKCIAHYNLGLIAVQSSDNLTASDNFRRAIELSERYKATIIMALLRIITKHVEKVYFIEKLIDLIASSTVKIKEKNLEKPMDFDFDDFKELVVLAFITDREKLYDKIVQYVTLLGNESVSQHLYNIAVEYLNQSLNWKNVQGLLMDIYKNKNNPKYNLDENTEYSTIKFLVYSKVAEKDVQELYDRFFEIFRSMKHTTLDFFEIDLFVNYIYSIIEEKDYKKALEYIELIKSKISLCDDQLLINFIAIYHMEYNVLTYVSQNEEAIIKARELVEFSKNKNFVNQKSLLLGEEGFSTIVTNALNFLEKSLNNTRSSIKKRKYGQNEWINVRYLDGKIINIKYKKVKDDLDLGKCVIII